MQLMYTDWYRMTDSGFLANVRCTDVNRENQLMPMAILVELQTHSVDLIICRATADLLYCRYCGAMGHLVGLFHTTVHL